MIERIDSKLVYADASRAKVVIDIVTSGSAEVGEELRFSGSIAGPYCQSAHTLPSQFSLEFDKKSACTATATIADPCYWSAELPMLYEVAVRLTRGDDVVEVSCESIGLKRPDTEVIDELGLN